jgi:hypothetical protein
MMKNADFQMFEVVCDVPDDGDAHDENLELYVLNLSTQLFLGRPFQDFTHLRLALFLFSHFRQSVFLLSLGLSSFDAFGHLPRYFLVAIVNDFNQKISTFIDSCAVEHKSFQNIANDRLMIDGKVKLKRVGRLSKRPYFGQNLFLPGGGHDEIIDEHFILILGDALLQDILIIFHERIDMQLHIQPLQTFILLEPHSASVVPYIDLTYLSDELLYLLVVKDVAESALHAIF